MINPVDDYIEQQYKYKLLLSIIFMIKRNINDNYLLLKEVVNI